MLCWIVRANKDGIAAIDANGIETSLSKGQRGWVSRSRALSLAASGDVEMLSPDGVTALQKEKAKPNGVQAKTESPAEAKQETSVEVTPAVAEVVAPVASVEGAPAAAEVVASVADSDVEPEAVVPVADSVSAATPVAPKVSVAPAPPRKGPQLKPLGSK